jgi:very-long-chain (3R)-3-hydroxyacyl-CoA dehydratase
MASKAYLLAYNAVQTVAWSFVLYHVVTTMLVQQGTASAAFARMGYVVWVAQNAAILEVVHAILRLVPSPVFTTALQVASRVCLVNVVYFLAVAQQHWVSQLMFGAWSLVEVVRYSYYVLQLLGAPIPFAVTWLRYSIFLFDYPLGCSGELGTLYVSLDAITAYNANLFYVTIAVMLSYVAGLPVMYSFMLSQRRKYLGGTKGSAAGSSGSAAVKAARTKKVE